MKKYIRTLLCAVLAVTLACPAFAAAPLTPEAAGAILREQGIYQGDGSGDLMLDKGLTRAELAMLLARLDDPEGEFAAYPDSFGYLCGFPDVPDWAKSAVGYCWNRGLIKGYDNSLYGAGDPVIPAAACTVVLRLYGHRAEEGTKWTYATACAYAVSLGLIGETAVQGATINRGDMAVLLCNAMGGKAEAEPQAPQPTNTDVDYSQEADPSVFTDELSRQVYNGIRDSILHHDSILAGEHSLVSMGQTERYGAVRNVIAALGECPSYEMYSLGEGEYACSPKYLESYQGAMEHTQGFVDSLAGLSQKEQVEQAVWYIADRIIYDTQSPFPGDVLAKDTPTPGRCMVYSYCLQFLCDRLDIPCVLVCNEVHEWNEVYVDGQWWVVDATTSDVPDASLRKYITVLQRAEDVTTDINVDMMPEVTAFAKEVLVPGSTK